MASKAKRPSVTGATNDEPSPDMSRAVRNGIARGARRAESMVLDGRKPSPQTAKAREKLRPLKKLAADEKAATGTEKMVEKAVGGIVALAVGIFLAAFLLPVAFSAVFDANTTGWDQSVVDIWNALPVIVVIGVMITLIYLAVRRNR